MAGVGNVFANELCFVFGLRPGTAVGSVADPLRLATRAQQMLWANRLRVNRTTTGNTRPGQDVWVYGRAGLGVPPVRHAHRDRQHRATGSPTGAPPANAEVSPELAFHAQSCG